MGERKEEEMKKGENVGGEGERRQYYKEYQTL